MAQFYFDNDFGLSVQQSEAHYSGERTSEIAVTHQGRVCDQNPISKRWNDRVKGWVNSDEVVDTLNEVRDLDPVKTCNHMRARDWPQASKEAT